MLKNIIVFIFVLGFCFLGIRYFEWKNIFFPTKEVFDTPKAFGFDYEDIYLKTEDGQNINAWFIPAKNDGRYTILFSHGNGGNIAHRIDKISILHNLGLDIFIYDYRGYGKSSGRPSERGIYSDARAAYDYLTKERGVSTDRIIAYGESLGAVVSIDLASQVKLKAIILEGVFSSAKDMSKEIYPFLPTFLLKSKMDSLTKIKQITAPKLFIHSQNDEIVPIELSQKLFDAAPEPKTFAVLRGGHNTCHMDSQKEYTDSIATFIENLKDF